MRRWAAFVVAILLLGGCGASDAGPVGAPQPSQETPPGTPVGADLYPNVVGAEATASGGTSWRLDVTMLSEYDSPQRYADAWRVLDGDETELGIRVLAHDHAGEQPFTRSATIDIPADVSTVYVEGRDQHNGWSGQRFELALDRH